MQELQTVQEIVQQLNIIDDTLFQKMAEGGNKEVCDLVENYARGCAEKAAKEATDKAIKDATESAKKFFENGVSYEVVRNSISTLSDEVLKGVYAEVKGV